jgi:hypothetical protein
MLKSNIGDHAVESVIECLNDGSLDDVGASARPNGKRVQNVPAPPASELP